MLLQAAPRGLVKTTLSICRSASLLASWQTFQHWARFERSPGICWTVQHVLPLGFKTSLATSSGSGKTTRRASGVRATRVDKSQTQPLAPMGPHAILGRFQPVAWPRVHVLSGRYGRLRDLRSNQRYQGPSPRAERRYVQPASAILRPSSSSRAAWTSPMPPRPRCSRIQ